MDSSQFNRFSMLSPLDHRYYFSNKELFDELAEYLSEEAVIKYNIKVEIALLQSIATICKLPKNLVQETLKNSKNIKPQDILAEEEKTRHNIRAIVNVLKKQAPEKIAQYIHLGATSFDISDTASSLRLKDLSNKVIIPLLKKVIEELIKITKKYIATPQVGRTHGQFAVPITVGHTFAEYVSRLGNSLLVIKDLTQKLVGKLSGAVGAYNALSLMCPDPLEFEKNHLESLGLLASEYSNQVCSPEPSLRLLLEYNIAFGIMANLADDLRNLQRSEIGEISEYFDEEHQVGSSTMPQKRNPWNSEHIKSLYKAFCPRVITFYNDQITEHQRDLTNSASQRFIADYLCGFAAAANRLLSVLKGLVIHKNRLNENLQKAGDSVLAEAAYILLALSGYNQAHEIVRNASIKMQASECSFIQALGDDKEIWNHLEQRLKILHFPPAKTFFASATNYIGFAVERANIIIKTHTQNLKKL